MPLYIRDDEVDALAIKVQRQTNAPSKTERADRTRARTRRNRAAVPLR